MKLNILSDLHLEFSPLPHSKTDADVIVLAGDIHLGTKGLDWAKQFDKPVIYVAGNHEYYGDIYECVHGKLTTESKGTNVHFLENKDVVIDGVRFLGCTLWTDFNLFGSPPLSKINARALMNDYRAIKMRNDTERLHPDDTEFFHNTSVKWLHEKLRENCALKTVVVTHHAPSILSVDKKYLTDATTPAFASKLDYLGNYKSALWIHGHVHNNCDYMMSKDHTEQSIMSATRVISNPRGYQYDNHPVVDLRGKPENKRFKPTLVVEI